MSRWPRLALALGAGALVALSLPPWGWWPLTFVGLAVFAAVVGTTGTSGRARAAVGWAFGVGWLAPGMGWMWFLTPPGYVIATVTFAALHGLASWAVRPGLRWEALARPAAHTLVEALRGSFPFGGVPLATLAIAQSAGPLAGVVRIGGSILLTWVAFSIGLALGSRVTGTRRPGRLGLVPAPFISLAAAAVILVIAAVAPRGQDTGSDPLRIATVQGGGPQGTLAIDTDPRDVFDRHLAATRLLGPDDDVDMVLWPENVITVRRGRFEDSLEFDEIVAEARRLDAPFVVGITERPAPGRFTNAQVVVLPNGEVTSRYDKVRRVPFGEYVPLRRLLVALGAPVDRVPTDAIPGSGPARLDTPSGPMAVAISWEVFFGGRVREGVRAGGEAVLNPTNGASYTGTILQTQQVATSRLRALESGRWLVQVSPTGFTAAITPAGQVVFRTGVSEQDVRVTEIRRRTGLTWYHRVGDAPVILAAAATLAATGWMPALRARRRSP